MNFRRTLDSLAGKVLRHLTFALVRPYYSLFYNVSCANKQLLQDMPGALILTTHVSRHDGPLTLAMLYSTTRIRPTAHYTEYYSWIQWFPMMLLGTIPMSAPKEWSADRKLAQKTKTLNIMQKVINNGNSIQLFPAGKIRVTPDEVIAPYLSGAYETLRALPNCPVVILRIDGLGKFQPAVYDKFWSFIGIKKGRRHVSVDIQLLKNGLDTTVTKEEFNKNLET